MLHFNVCGKVQSLFVQGNAYNRMGVSEKGAWQDLGDLKWPFGRKIFHFCAFLDSDEQIQAKSFTKYDVRLNLGTFYRNPQQNKFKLIFHP